MIEGTTMQVIVTAIREESLNRITKDDILKEGFFTIDGFRMLWNSLHEQQTWEANPIVWVIDFRYAGDLQE